MLYTKHMNPELSTFVHDEVSEQRTDAHNISPNILHDLEAQSPPPPSHGGHTEVADDLPDDNNTGHLLTREDEANRIQNPHIALEAAMEENIHVKNMNRRREDATRLGMSPEKVNTMMQRLEDTKVERVESRQEQYERAHNMVEDAIMQAMETGTAYITIPTPDQNEQLMLDIQNAYNSFHLHYVKADPYIHTPQTVNEGYVLERKVPDLSDMLLVEDTPEERKYRINYQPR